jgi:hypothetical protein
MSDFARHRMTAAERELLAAAAEWPELPTLADISEAALRDLAARRGIDFATALIFDRVLGSDRHGPFIRSLHAIDENGLSAALRLPRVVIVPGAFYRHDPASGADGRVVLECVSRLGCATDTIPLESFGSLRRDAQQIVDWLRGQSDGRPLVLVSLSKAGAGVKLALSAKGAAAAFRNVRAWISLSGTYFGTPLVNWLYSQWWRLPLIRALFWFRRYDYGAIRELARGPSTVLDFDPAIPGHLRIVHVVGFPLTPHMTTPLARRGYRRLSASGPNDGGPILLADVARLPGYVYPVWGADHYLQPAQCDGLISRLLHWALDEKAEAKTELVPK